MKDECVLLQMTGGRCHVWGVYGLCLTDTLTSATVVSVSVTCKPNTPQT